MTRHYAVVPQIGPHADTRSRKNRLLIMPIIDVTLMLVHIRVVSMSSMVHSVRHADLQSGMSESKSNIIEIQEVAVEDMKVILKYIHGVLDALPEERLQSLVLATDRLQV